MRIDMTLQAVRKFAVQTRIVRRFVTTRATKRTAVVTAVAFDTGQLMVSLLTFRQGRNLIIVTGLTETIRQGPTKDNLSRSMRNGMAEQTIRIPLPVDMRLVTSGALLGLRVLLVTTVAILLSVSARCDRETVRDTCMTRHAGRLGIFRLRQVMPKRIVPQVTILTVAHREMRFVGVMADRALWHNRLPVRRMRTVTTDARLFLMRFPLLLQQFRRLLMTGDADRSGLARFLLDHLRQVGRMTLHTIDLRHVRNMRSVAILTLHQGTVLPRMAFATIERGMLVRVLLIESLLIIVAGQTDRF